MNLRFALRPRRDREGYGCRRGGSLVRCVAVNRKKKTAEKPCVGAVRLELLDIFFEGNLTT